MVTPRSLTCSLGGISCPLMLRHSVFFHLSPKNIVWNFDGLALIPLAVRHSNSLYLNHTSKYLCRPQSYIFPTPDPYKIGRL